MGQYGINMAGVFGAWFLMSRGIGRRTLYLYGQWCACLFLHRRGLWLTFVLLQWSLHHVRHLSLILPPLTH